MSRAKSRVSGPAVSNLFGRLKDGALFVIDNALFVKAWAPGMPAGHAFAVAVDNGFLLTISNSQVVKIHEVMEVTG